MLEEIEGTKRQFLDMFGRDYKCSICGHIVFIPDSQGAECVHKDGEFLGISFVENAKTFKEFWWYAWRVAIGMWIGLIIGLGALGLKYLIVGHT